MIDDDETPIGMGRDVLVIFEPEDPGPKPEASSFADRVGLWWLGKLEPGFKHCFAMVRAERFDGWIAPNWTHEGLQLLEIGDEPVTVDGVDGVSSITFPNYGAMVAASADAGLVHLAWAKQKPFKGIWRPTGPATCVELVKHMIGLEAPGVVTPYQLYLAMTNRRQTNGRT